jgi:hypothetical protein
MAIAVMTVATALNMQLPLTWQPPAAQAAQAAAAMAAPGSMGNIPADEAQELQDMLSEDVALPSQLLDFLKLFEKVGASSSRMSSRTGVSSNGACHRQHHPRRPVMLLAVPALGIAAADVFCIRQAAPTFSICVAAIWQMAGLDSSLKSQTVLRFMLCIQSAIVLTV